MFFSIFNDPIVLNLQYIYQFDRYKNVDLSNVPKDVWLCHSVAQSFSGCCEGKSLDASLCIENDIK
jgi:hypothetical protein